MVKLAQDIFFSGIRRFYPPLRHWFLNPPNPFAKGKTNRVSYDGRIDEYLGTKDHVSVELHYHAPHYFASTSLAPQLATEAETVDGGFVGPWVNRFNWDHTFAPTLLNNINYGYLDFRGR